MKWKKILFIIYTNVVFLECSINSCTNGSHYKTTIIIIIILIFFLVFCRYLLICISIRIRLFSFFQFILFVWYSWKRIDGETFSILVEIYCCRYGFYIFKFFLIDVSSFNNILVCIFSGFFCKTPRNNIHIMYTSMLLFL